MPHPFPAPENHFLSEHVRLILDSYRHWTSEDLIPRTADLETMAERLFNAPFALASHDAAQDPLFNYANLKALEAFGYSWSEWVLLPSRESAEPENREERARLLEEVHQQGYSEGYRGIRIGTRGRFEIQSAKVWNLLNAEGAMVGQAASFPSWRSLTT